MKQKAPYWIIPCLFFVSCSTVGHLKTSDNTTSDYPATNPNDVAVYSTVPNANTKYTVIGQVVVSADAGENAKKSVNLLKKEAALLGADAVIDLTLEIGMGYWTNAIKATGTAIKINN
ncbi:hypothetical protein [Flavobacterium algicola]|uniref:hypothetical protein n=1 Tax=Flavobacterium algicola TaxID=556529 RepID=UPI001EFE81FD|nr:hypothetical protein [Flavobacterium algicola]MCG9794114.1 hypothetical protein [Flavobacterium algicola]